MKDIFYEEVVVNSNYKRERLIHDVLTVLGILSVFLIFCWIIIFFFLIFTMIGSNFLANLIVFTLPAIILCFSAWLFFKARNKYCVEFDYTLVSDSFRIDKVIRCARRFKLFDLYVPDVEKIGKFGSDTCNRYLSNQSIECEYCTSNDSPEETKDFYYVVCPFQGKNTLFVLECSEQFIINLNRGCKRGVLEADYK